MDPTLSKLTEKEEEVMALIWKLGSCAPKEVQALYDEPRPHINTVAMVFQSLEKKGYLTHRPQGRGFIYEPAVQREDYGNRRISQFVDAFFSDSYMSVVSALVRDKKVDEADLLQFLADLRKQKVQGEQSTEAT
jgi:predicted transcriptional regulator